MGNQCLSAGRRKTERSEGTWLGKCMSKGGTDSFMSSLRYFTRVWTHLYFPSHRYRTREAWTGICSPWGSHVGSGNFQLAPLPPLASLKCELVGRRESALKSREALQAEVSSRTCGQEGVSPEVQGSSPGRGLVTDLQVTTMEKS